mmetsp:Transcript_13031/g.24478  ORF Transcript_13031/g.24478 Transcript_13031/m.24478 type:complete len:165 (+) Transcript_13031:89-583(+)
MGTKKHTQRKAKASVDEKLRLSTPSRDLLESLAVSCASKPSQDNTFQYAFALAKSGNTRELEYAVTILDGLIKEKYEYQIDCMYGAATALYRLERYDEARARCEAILRANPDNVNTAELHLACMEGADIVKEKKMKRAAIEGTVGVAAIGLALSVAGMMLGKKK